MIKNLKKKFSKKSFKSLDSYHGKWLRLDQTEQGEDIISRTTSEKYFSGVNILAIKEPNTLKDGASDTYSSPFNLIVIGNYRVPAERRILEVPAGLAEKGMTVEENILKEMKEETGVRNPKDFFQFFP